MIFLKKFCLLSGDAGGETGAGNDSLTSPCQRLRLRRCRRLSQGELIVCICCFFLINKLFLKSGFLFKLILLLLLPLLLSASIYNFPIL